MIMLLDSKKSTFSCVCQKKAVNSDSALTASIPPKLVLSRKGTIISHSRANYKNFAKKILLV